VYQCVLIRIFPRLYHPSYRKETFFCLPHVLTLLYSSKNSPSTHKEADFSNEWLLGICSRFLVVSTEGIIRSDGGAVHFMQLIRRLRVPVEHLLKSLFSSVSKQPNSDECFFFGFLIM